MNGYHAPNGEGAHSNGVPPAARAVGSRVPTVSEALPYTPFSSIVPFSPDIIPSPLALPTTPASVFGTYPDVVHASRVLEKLSAGATSAENASKRCEQTIRDVQKFLSPDTLTEFKFKEPKRAYANGKSSSTNIFRAPVPLSSFARMVLDNADTHVSFRYLTPESPGAEDKTDVINSRSYPRMPQPTPQVRIKTSQSHQTGYATPQTTEPPSGSQGSRLQVVVVPTTLTPAQRAEFVDMSEADSLAGAQNPTPSHQYVANGQRSVSVDQKQKGTVAVQSLQAFLQEIFEAEDQLETDTSEAAATQANAIFAVRDTGDGSIPMLHAVVQAKLDAGVQKVVANGRLQSIDTNSLVHAQRLCESAVVKLGSTALSISDDWADPDVEEWAQRIEVAETGAVAARTLLRIMVAGTHTKELQSEDFLRNAITALTTVIESCIVPVVEERASIHEKIKGIKDEAPSNQKFIIAMAHRKALQTLLHAATKSFRILGDFLVRSGDDDESAFSSVEYLCKLLIFAENASNERDSVLGIQNFETTRRCAMDVLAKMFAKYTEQRQYILDGVLTSLEKLPGSKQSARQFRLLDAKPIQLVSALLMRLVQTSSTHTDESLQGRSKAVDLDDGASVADSEDSADDEDDEDDNIKVSPTKARSHPEELSAVVKPLHDAAQANATYIVKVLLQRGMATSKSSDEPYRKLLDIFTEDFLNVLGSTDWPSAELLLRTLVIHMIGTIESTKSTAPSRVLALELLGTIGSGILDIWMSARKALRSLEPGDTQVGKRLADLLEQLDSGDMETNTLLAFDGPFRVVLEYLQARGLDDAQLRSAQGYHVMQWASSICAGRDRSTEADSSESPRMLQDLQRKVRSMIFDLHWLEEHHEFPAVATAEGRLASIVITLSSKFCKAFNRIFTILLTSMSSEQSTVKSRSLKSVVTLLEKDPSILDRNAYILNHIFKCTKDDSPLVRDSALKLVGDCVRMRPALAVSVYRSIVARTTDTTHGVRKRAIKLLKDIYLQNDDVAVRSNIADAIIARIEDPEESVTELARTTMEEIWFSPFQGLKLDGDAAVGVSLKYKAQAALLIKTVEASDIIDKVLEALIRDLLSKSKAAVAHSKVCNALIRVLFDGIIGSADIPGAPSQRSILECLVVFAKACPKLFTASQLERLEPYTQNLSKNDDLIVYRSAVTILRHVMPFQSTLKPNFLEELQGALMKSVPRVPKSELSEVIPCLWTITGMLGDSTRLVNFVKSALTGVHNMRAIDFSDPSQPIAKASKLMVIIGQCGNACDFESNIVSFKEQFRWYKGNTVAGLVIEIMCPFTSPKQPLELREVALEAVCLVSQRWPKMFLRPDIVNAIKTAFEGGIPSLEEVLLTGLEGFICANEVSSNDGDPSLGSGVASGTERLGRTYVAVDKDGASTSIAQGSWAQILRLALKSCDQAAYLAAKLVVSINRQGLVHPRESGPALVALETSSNLAIANLAFAEHKAMHTRQESQMDNEYMRAVQLAFEYQRDTIGDAAGWTGHPPVSKLHLLWELLKTGRAQVRKKVLGSLSQKLDFDSNTLNMTAASTAHLAFVRFCVENLAFFDYDRVDELLHLLTSLEKMFVGTGTIVAQAIESEVLQLQMNTPLSSDAIPVGASATLATSTIDPARLRQLAVSAQILSLIWETRSYVRRLWNMHKHVNKSKAAAKDNNKAPIRISAASTLTDAYQVQVVQLMSSAVTPESQHAICRSFVELMSVDNEIRVGSGAEDDAEADTGYETPSDNASHKSASVPPPSGGGRGRKRKANGAASTPRKKGRPSNARRKSGSAKPAPDDEEDGGWD